jgi:peptidoglycan hydrolase CwlO-like protein
MVTEGGAVPQTLLGAVRALSPFWSCQGHQREIEKEDIWMSKLRGLKYALAALVCIAAFIMLLHVTAQLAAAAPLPGEIFIDVDGDRIYNATVDLGLFPTIQDAIDNATSGDVVVVGSGTYAESLVIPVDISLVGANEGIDPNTGVRVNETRLIPGTVGFGPLVLIDSSNVVIDGFTLNGSNPALGSFGTINGVNLTMPWGIANFGGETNLTIVNNVMETFDTAIMLSGTSDRTMIMFDLFDNIEPVIGGGFAVQLTSDFSSNVTSCVFTRTNTAIFASSFSGLGISYLDIEWNTMSVTWNGVVLDHLAGTMAVLIDNNVIEAIGSANAGILIQGDESGYGTWLRYDAISGMQYGIMLIDNPSTAAFSMVGDLIINCNYGIYAQEGSVAFVAGDSTYTVDSTMIVNSGSYAVYINNTNSLGSTLTQVNFLNGNVVLGGLNGAGVEGTGAVLAFSGAEPINFIGITDQYIRLIGSPRNVDATQVLFDYNIGANSTLAQNFAIEDKVFHALDQSGLGLVRYVSGQMFVTQLSGSIQRAIDVANSGDIINVQAGTYAESLTIPVSVSLLGPNAGLDPNTMVRVPEANIIPNSVGLGPLILLGANDVTIDGFNINGSNPALGRLGLINGINLTMAFGVQNFGGENNFVLMNNMISTFDTAVQLFGESSGGLITHNLFDNIDLASFNGFAINFVSDYFSDITNNVFTRTYTAIFASTYSAAGSATIDSNTMSVYWDGIILDRFGGSTGVWTVSDNSIMAIGTDAGITVEGMQDSAIVNLVGNAIDSMQYGIMLIDNPTTIPVTISSGLLINCVYGIYAQEGSIAFVDGNSNYVVDSVLFVNPSAYAIYVNDTDSLSSTTTNVTVQNGTIVLGGLNGIGVEGTGAIVFFNGVDPINFLGVTSFYFKLINSPRDINAMQVLFEGLTGTAMSNATLVATEEKILDKLDDSGLGRVRIVSAIIIVPPGDSIQAAIDAASPGDTIIVLPGNFTESLLVWKPLTLLGPNAGIDPNTGVRGPEACIIPPSVGIGPLILINSSGVRIDGFCINGSNPLVPGNLGLINGINMTMAWGIFNLGIFDLSSENNITIVNNMISTFDTAIALGGESRDNLIGNNLFDNIDAVVDNGFAVRLNSDFFADVTKNAFTRTYVAIFASDYTATGSALIDGNMMSVSWDGIVLRNFAPAVGVWTISNNVVEAIGSDAGITLQGLASSVIMTGDAVSDMFYGILLIDNPAAGGISIANELLINCVYGIYAQEGSFAFIDGDSNYVVDAVLIVNPTAYAIYVNDTDSISLAVTNVTVRNGTIVLGGLNGIGVRGTGAIVFFSGSDPLNLIGVSSFYFRLIDSPRNIDARQMLFEGLTGASMTAPQIAAVEVKILDKVDNPALGVVMIVSAQVIVTKLNDLTANGATLDDTPIQGWVVYLWTDGVQGAPQLTGVDGTYTWSNLGPGNYSVSESVQSGWTATSAATHDFGPAFSGGVYNFTFTNFQNVNITVTKLNDLTGNGQTVDDTPIQGWTVYLWTDGVQGPAQLTGADGTFTWSDLGPGVYNVSEDVTAGWTATSATNHGFGTVVSGGVYNFTFTNFQNVNITVTKLDDLTSNGQSVDDTPIQGWTVYLWTNGVQGPPQLTGVDGTFTWSDLGPGVYNVSEDVTAGWTATSATNHGFGTVVSGGVYNFTFTNFRNVNITVTKLNDLTGNGQTVDDTPIQGWTVYLWTNGVQGPAQLTGADGTFTWSDLGLGSYMVSEDVPVGWTATSATSHIFGTVVSGGVYNFTFTNFQNVSFTVSKLLDLTGNGQSIDDLPLQNWTVYLWTNGVQGPAQRTGVGGVFTWSNLGPGSYMVSEAIPFGWTATSGTSHDFGVAVSGEAYSFTFTNFRSEDILPIDITLDVGSLYFPGETVTWYVLFTINGVIMDPDTIFATLYGPDSLVIDLSGNLTQLTNGLWTVAATIPGNASSGEYTLVVMAGFANMNFGATLRTFLISATLMDQYSLIVGIDEDIATIQTTLGTITVSLSEISANLTSIEGTLATIQTSIGLLQVDVDLINATLVSINGTLATITSDLGEIQADVEDIQADIVSIDGTLVTIQTTLGDIIVQLDEISSGIEEIAGDVAIINTTLGQVHVSVDAINAIVVDIQGTVVTIQTDLGTVVENVTLINAHVTNITNTLVTITTAIGTLQTSVTNVNAHITAVENDIAVVQTTVGTITVNLAALNTTVTSIRGTVATIHTSLGTLTGTVTSIQGDIATIQTDIGTLHADVSKLQTDTQSGVNYGLISIVLLVIVIIILIFMYFWKLRKTI